MIQECIDLKISDTVMTTQEGINSEVEGANTRRVLNIPSKRSLYLMRSSHTSAHLQKKSTHMLLILNFSTLTFITNARTTMPYARLHFQMVCTQSKSAEIPQHMFVQIFVQVGGDRKRRTSRTTLRTPTPLVISVVHIRRHSKMAP